jgi:hypothetical protein
MGYLYLEALVKMKQYYKGIDITTTKLINHKYKNYYLNYAKRVLYRFPTIQSS